MDIQPGKVFLNMKVIQLLLMYLMLGIPGVMFGQTPPRLFDVILRNGLVMDGSGKPAYRADVALKGDRIAAIGDLKKDKGVKETDLSGLAIAPGFINMLSWADGTLLSDGRGMSDIKQGVTTEVFGEGWSPGPRKPSPKDQRWGTLGEYLSYAEKKGVSPNIASFVGATTVRMYVLGSVNRAPTGPEMEQMKGLVGQAMEEGAMGLGSSLIYAPADYATTQELTELAKVASAYGGIYITHMRSESDRILPAMNETFRIAREASIPAEIYHLKINHSWNWNKIDVVIGKIDSARKAGLDITANMYTYNASSTGLTARIPTWVQEGGMAALRKRLKDPAIRARVLDELARGIPQKNSDPKDVLILGFHRDSLNRLYRNKRLDEIARLHGKNADETVLDLIIADKSSQTIPCIFFLISEDNVRRMLKLPFVSICSDASTLAAEKGSPDTPTHPRVYGSFARLLGHYAREVKLMSQEEAVRRMTALPAARLGLRDRGQIKTGYVADLAIFDPATVIDKATFDDSHAYAEGVKHVFVNGIQVLENGQHTGRMPGRAIRGPGYRRSVPAAAGSNH